MREQMTVDEIKDVIQARRDGRKIEWSPRAADGQVFIPWYTSNAPQWDFDNFCYRVKPEPHEWWGVKLRNPNATYCDLHKTRDEAFSDLNAKLTPDVFEVMHVTTTTESMHQCTQNTPSREPKRRPPRQWYVLLGDSGEPIDIGNTYTQWGYSTCSRSRGRVIRVREECEVNMNQEMSDE